MLSHTYKTHRLRTPSLFVAAYTIVIYKGGGVLYLYLNSKVFDPTQNSEMKSKQKNSLGTRYMYRYSKVPGMRLCIV